MNDGTRHPTRRAADPLEVCPLCGSSPEILRELSPITFYGKEIEPPGPVFSVVCSSCGYHGPKVRAAFCTTTGHEITETEAEIRARRGWNERTQTAGRDAASGLRNCPRCGRSASPITTAGTVNTMRVREKIKKTTTGITVMIECHCGAGIAETLPASAPPTDLEDAATRLRSAWNRQIAQKAREDQEAVKVSPGYLPKRAEWRR